MSESHHVNYGPNPSYYGGFLWGNEEQYCKGLQSAEEPDEAFINTREDMAQELRYTVEEAFSYFGNSCTASWEDVFLPMLEEYITSIDFDFYAGEQLEFYLEGRREALGGKK